ncbi:Mitochondrial matrix iron chaperone [Conglomerata obtusa]
MEKLNCSSLTYAKHASATLAELCKILEEQRFKHSIEEGDGTLTYNVPKVGVYVFNKQPANLQIWSSSPLTGPNRFYLGIDKRWYNSKDKTELLTYINQEIAKIKEKTRYT